MTAPVRVERAQALAVVIIESPPVNLFDSALYASLGDAIAELEADPPRAALFRAEGRVVSGGVDVHDFDALGGDRAAAARMFEQMLEIVHRVEALPCPTVFAAHALCLTAAFELALGCDLLLAARSARFGLVEKVVGLTPAMGGTQRLAMRAGPARAREFVMTAELFDAETLERWNVVNRVFDDEGFTEAAVDFASKLADGPTRAHLATKQIVAAAGAGGPRAADAIVPDVAGGLFETEDLRGAVASFLRDGPGRATYSGR
jgi:enoyl-CoA hydratase/carnithine racemase